MNIQGFQKLTLLDFPGKVACTLFTGGCNLRCPFCHNASLVNTPTLEGNMQEEIMDYLSRRKGLLDGVCITGGEPLLQPDLEAFIRGVRELGLLIKLDTNGSLPRRLKPLLEAGLVDYVAMDVKSSPAGYARATGSEMPFSVFEESIGIIKASGVAHEFRTTAVKGIHSVTDFEGISEILGDTSYFIQRFVDSGNLLGEGCSAFSDEENGEILRAVRRHTPRAELRG